MNDLCKKLEGILSRDIGSGVQCHLFISVLEGSSGKPPGYELTYGCMYESPGLGFKHLKALSDLFETDNIDVNNYSEGGCESCDYGSDYGYTIQIRDLKAFDHEMSKLVGKDIYKSI